MKMRKCPQCSIYTLKAKCPQCSSETKDAHYKYVHIRGIKEKGIIEEER